MSLDWPGMEKVEYECARCGARFKGEELLFIDQLKCPRCGCKVLKKTRPPIVRRIRAI